MEGILQAHRILDVPLREVSGTWLYLLSDKSAAIARLDDLPPGGGTATCAAAWRLGGLDGKPEGLAFTAEGRAIVALDTRKARHNLVFLEPPDRAVAQHNRIVSCRIRS